MYVFVATTVDVFFIRYLQICYLIIFIFVQNTCISICFVNYLRFENSYYVFLNRQINFIILRWSVCWNIRFIYKIYGPGKC